MLITPTGIFLPCQVVQQLYGSIDCHGWHFEQGQALRCIAAAGLYTDVANHALALKGGQVHGHRAHAGDVLLQLHGGHLDIQSHHLATHC